jgi:hypothetical protein
VSPSPISAHRLVIPLLGRAHDAAIASLSLRIETILCSEKLTVYCALCENICCSMLGLASISDLMVAMNRRRTSANSPLGILRFRGSPFNALFARLDILLHNRPLPGTAVRYKYGLLLTLSRSESASNSSQTKPPRETSHHGPLKVQG